MKKSLSVIILAVLFLAIGCDKEEKKVYDQIDVITGINLADENGSLLGRWRVPNDKSLGVTAYPNPAIDVMFLYSEIAIKSVWVINTSCFEDSDFLESTYDMSQIDFPISDIEDKVISNISLIAPVESISINISSLTEGHYRVFYQLIDNEIGWANFTKLNKNYGDSIFVKLVGLCN